MDNINDGITNPVVHDPQYCRQLPTSSQNGQNAIALSAQIPDPWNITTTNQSTENRKSWKEMSSKEKVKSIFIGISKSVGLLLCLYFFVCSLDTLSLGFRVVGGRTTGKIFRQSDILKNPVVGVMVGILTTVLVQSSSTSTSIIVSMVAAEFLEVHVAIPIVMGANIGTSITNTIVSLTQVGDRNQFRRAFAGATVHDMFNWLTVICLLIVEVTTGYLEKVTGLIMDKLVDQNTTKSGQIEILGVITKPLVNQIVQLDKHVLVCWSQENCTKHDNSSLIKFDCGNGNSTQINEVSKECTFLFAKLGWSDPLAGTIILVGSLIVLCSCLVLIVKILNSVLQGQIAVIIKKTLNAKIPYVPWITGYIAIVVGAVMTFLVQSSSVFTSALTPLVGLGVLSVERVYPLTLGSNIGTTTTALIASLAAKGASFKPSLQIALCHLLFNISGIIIFYPIPFLRFPIRMAKFLGDTTAKYRWFAIVYMVVMFIILPLIFMALSYAGAPYVITAASLICTLFLSVTLINLLRDKYPSILPEFLKSWKWLPIWFRSLEPYDQIFSQMACCKGKSAEVGDKDNITGNTGETVVMEDTKWGKIEGNVNPTFQDQFF